MRFKELDRDKNDLDTFKVKPADKPINQGEFQEILIG